MCRRKVEQVLAKEIAVAMYGEGNGSGVFKNIDVICPISQHIMREPVVTVDGHSFEKTEIEKWFAMKRMNNEEVTSPATGKILSNTTVLPNIGLNQAKDGILDQMVDAQAKIVQMAKKPKI